ncbi:MAG: hypothetical protein HY288_16040 [Planctomycetia bacterium]|nr:hypothetical protein [Planctomycetia bacterium]
MSTTLEPDTAKIPDPLRNARREVLRRLIDVRWRLRSHLLVEGLFWTTSGVMLTAGASLALDWLLRFNLPTRMGMLAIAVAAISVLAVRRLVRPLLLPLADLDLAELLDRRCPGVGQQISNVLQLPDLLASERYASPSMVHAAVIECAEALEGVDLTATLNAERRRKLLAVCGTWVLLAIGFYALWPATAELWARRWFAGSDLRWPQTTYLSVVGLENETKLLVPRGEMSLLQISARPEFVEDADRWRLAGRGEPLVVEAAAAPQSEPPEKVSIALTLGDGSQKRGNATQFDDANFRYELPPLAESAQLRITGGDDWFGPITIEPIERPTVASLEIVARRPGSGEEQIEKVGEGTGQLLFLPETQLELRLAAKDPLESAEVSDKGMPVAGWQRADERRYMLRWTMKESLALEFRLRSRHGGLSSKPYFLAIGLLKDREPRVTIRSSGVGRRITPVARIPLSLHATDDFGVAALALDMERTDVRDDKPHVDTKRVDVEDAAAVATQARTDLELAYDLELRERGLAPGNLLKLRGAAIDACALGAQAGNSRWLAFQIVTSDELFYEILTRQREQRARFAASLDNVKAISKSLLSLEKPEEAVGLARTQQVVNRQVWQVANQIDASLMEMTLNDLGNPQAREILQIAIITPLRTLHGDLLARLRAGLDNLAAQPTVSEERRGETQAIADQAIQVMQTILTQMAQWESFVDVVNQLKRIIQRQDQVLKSTEEIEKTRTKELFDE